MLRRTKIVATVGPATDDPQVLTGIIRAGVDVVRVNLAHGTAEDHLRRVRQMRECAASMGRYVGVLADLQGPKIRIDRFRNSTVELREGNRFVLDAELPADAGTEEAVGITYKNLPGDVKAGDTLLLDDGRLVLGVEAVDGARVICRVVIGGTLSNNKGINRQGGGLSAPALTDKDREDIAIAARLKADYLAVSFPRSAADIEEARALLQAAGGHGHMVAKIERVEAVEAIESILEVSEAVMIARGDLGVEIGDAELPGVQKRIIRQAREMNRVSITATQMMESMIHSQIPTRAEVLDVANAVIDGTDAVMLSAETATGDYPVKAVEAMARICLGAEKQWETQHSTHRIDSHFDRVDEATAMATMYTANHLGGVAAIVTLTESGTTALWMSRISSAIPIYALTRHESTRRRVTLYRGVYPLRFDVVHVNPSWVIQAAVNALQHRHLVKKGDLVILTKGDYKGVAGGTNTIKIVRVGDRILPPEGA
ncbi:MAG TPA: pyruvate kinase [Candidatus Competibacteraceae bacterium]|nr:pyruvate kinase [Candidatus Competibacteraceae bacterium]